MERPQEGAVALAERFERDRRHLHGVAHRMLGSADEAQDAVQETWLRAGRAGADGVENVTGWLTTILGRVCLDMLRARRRRPEDLTGLLAEPAAATPGGTGPEEEAVLAESVGLALLVVLDRLGPAERVAFVLHDMFAVPFEQIAAIVERSPVAAKKLASRARARVHGATPLPAADLAGRRKVVEAFLAASRAGDLEALVAVLDPDVVRRTDLPGAVPVLRGARRVAEETRGNAAHARFARPILVNGALGAAVAPGGRLRVVLLLTIIGGRVVAIDVVTAPAALDRLELSLAD
ncbi:DNA-directed RNA polymerase sigma-70 factor [Sphaerisporangium krabiense]|uniref:RNA polymerase sigma-70 factor (ECF subfamily) n=1 Tax=Sphaerisporangium krabiense TaxID=763782 RepID=A0A7W9DTK0_9ACTN|nr:sigma-70 family RNA polymerase sigma factor [Sphaerisporangium krabiense]MBB5630711.1 RNA polymerase sigma-70 factor (ECF subfamily) [Sphaerisporangium krabiense]GII67422.1 DNA-directed RNA polymerase sigma-70 factor [Sphaerisporangium krabiense]